MDLKATEEIAVPIDVAWRGITEFDRFEEALRRQEVTLHREGQEVGEGTTWEAEFPFMGRTLKATASVARMESPRLLRLEGQGTGIIGYAEIALTQLDEERCRADVSAGLKAKAIGAQVILQPLRVAKGRLQEQLAERVGRIARRVEEQYASGES